MKQIKTTLSFMMSIALFIITFYDIGTILNLVYDSVVLLFGTEFSIRKAIAPISFLVAFYFGLNYGFVVVDACYDRFYYRNFKSSLHDTWALKLVFFLTVFFLTQFIFSNTLNLNDEARMSDFLIGLSSILTAVFITLFFWFFSALGRRIFRS